MSEPTTGRDETAPDLQTETHLMTEPTAELASEPTTDLPRDLTTDLPRDATTGAAGPRGPSLPTVIWGAIFALIAAGVIAAQTSDVDLNLDVTAPTALLVAGVVLVIWGIAGLGRSRLRR
jgi:hypothetical protein